MKTGINVLIMCGFLFLVGCKDKTIKHYEAPKDLVIKSQHDAPHLHVDKWNVPSYWTQAPANDMQLVAFNIKKDHHALTASIVSLAGNAGGILPNINRWRAQIGLATVSELPKIKTDMLQGFESQILTIRSEKTDTGLFIVILNRKDNTLFFKLRGSLALLKPESVNFLSLIQSINLSHDL